MNAPEKKPDSRQAYFVILGAVLLVVAVGVYFLFSKSPEKPPVPGSGKKIQVTPQPEEPKKEGRIIDYSQTNSGQTNDTTALMDKRKAKYGVDKSLDMIVTSEETISLGGRNVKMKKVLDQVKIAEGDIVEDDLARSPKETRDPPSEFGIYVVRKNDNIWNIHFRLLKEYFDKKGISLAPRSDEPLQDKSSSGVGKILKFSENIVHIYNVKTGKLDTSLNVLDPMSKIVVYNMGDVFDLLEDLDISQVDMIQFDGNSLWLPAKQ